MTTRTYQRTSQRQGEAVIDELKEHRIVEHQGSSKKDVGSSPCSIKLGDIHRTFSLRLLWPFSFETSLPVVTGRGFLTGGGGGIRTLVTRVTGKTVFETAAFNHSATPPRGMRPAWSSPTGTRRTPAVRSRPGIRSLEFQWRRDRDSNPRYAFGAHTISNRAPSASSVISPLLRNVHARAVRERAAAT